ncbi:MAG: hypothetical protein ACO242_02990 [Candidatus Fonsibacter ubiquis]
MTIGFSLCGQLINPYDTCVRLGVGGLGEPYGLKLSRLEHRAQDRRMHLGRYQNVSPDIIDADGALLAADLGGHSSAPGQELGVPDLEQIELCIA